MSYNQIPTSVTTAIQVLNPTNLDATPFFRADSTGAYSNGTLITAGGGNVFGPDTPTTNGLPVWQDPLTPGSQGDTLVNTAVIIDPITNNVSGVNNLTVVGIINAGLSGTAGSVVIYPSTVNVGYLHFAATNNSGNFITTVTNAAQGQASTVSIPDPGASTANFILSSATGIQNITSAVSISGAVSLNSTLVVVGATTIEGAVLFDSTFSVDGAATIDNLTGQTLTLGANASPGEVILYSNTAGAGPVTISNSDTDTSTFAKTFTFGTVGQATTITVPDPGAASANVLLSASSAAQTITGSLNVTGSVTADSVVAGMNGNSGVLEIFSPTLNRGAIEIVAANNAANYITTITNVSQGQASTISIPDPGASTADFILSSSAASQTISGNITLSGAVSIDDFIGQTITLGANASPGDLVIYSNTAGAGTATFSNSDADTGTFAKTLTFGSVAQSTVYTLPDPGAGTANIIVSTSSGGQTIAGLLTVTNTLTCSADASVGTNLVVNNACTVDGGLTAGALYINGATKGTVTLNGATPVPVTNANITDNSVVTFGLKTVSGTVGVYPTIQTVTVGGGFSVLGSITDMSVYNYLIEN